MKITSLVLRQNTVDYPAGTTMAVDCESNTPLSTYWRKPLTKQGIHYGYSMVRTGPEVTKPTTDSVKCLHVKNKYTQEDLYIALQDNGSVDDYNSRCNACCDDVTPMPAVTVPDVISEETACADEDGNRNFFSITRDLVAGEVYDVTASIDGVALTPVTNPEGYASLAAIETFADANWGPNTFAVSGNKLTMTSATATTGSLHVIVKKYYESNAPGALAGGENYVANATVNGVALPQIEGVDDAALTTVDDLLNANATWAAYGRWSVVAGKIRLVSSVATSASIVITKV